MKGELLMASNFQLFFNQNRHSLHLHMFGDFDGISAYELINALKKHNENHFEVFIDTSDLNKIHVRVRRKRYCARANLSQL